MTLTVVPRVLTDRLELKSLTSRAAAALSDDRTETSRLLGASLPDAWPEANVLGLLALRPPASEEAERFGVWVVIERESGSVVGDIGFKGPPDDTGTIEIGYSIVADWRRRGYAKEAAAGLVGWALTQPDVRTIVAATDPGNEPSMRTLEAVGFHRTGEDDGEIRWRYVPEP